MLNRLFGSGLGFGWSVRASAFIVLACLVVANLLMRPRKDLSHGAPSTSNLTIKALFTDLPYVLLVIGWVFPDLPFSLPSVELRPCFLVSAPSCL